MVSYLGKRYRRISSREELIRAVEEAWKAIPDEQFIDLCRTTTPADTAAKTAANAATTNVVRATAAKTASKVATDAAATLIAATGAPGGNATMSPASAATAVALAAAPPPSPVVPPVVPPRCPSRCLLVVGRNDSEFPRWVAVTPLWAVIEDVERVIGKEIEFCGEVLSVKLFNVIHLFAWLPFCIL
ncbi:hypothetical protein HOY82DRAFT_535482 [Tuber indicum]|nr:hypothetical protein HOY82DRAFT_535482 [Tuber indicum]